jgi:hypothetical protein
LLPESPFSLATKLNVVEGYTSSFCLECQNSK